MGAKPLLRALTMLLEEEMGVRAEIDGPSAAFGANRLISDIGPSIATAPRISRAATTTSSLERVVVDPGGSLSRLNSASRLSHMHCSSSASRGLEDLEVGFEMESDGNSPRGWLVSRVIVIRARIQNLVRAAIIDATDSFLMEEAERRADETWRSKFTAKGGAAFCRQDSRRHFHGVSALGATDSGHARDDSRVDTDRAAARLSVEDSSYEASNDGLSTGGADGQVDVGSTPNGHGDNVTLETYRLSQHVLEAPRVEDARIRRYFWGLFSRGEGQALAPTTEPAQTTARSTESDLPLTREDDAQALGHTNVQNSIPRRSTNEHSPLPLTGVEQLLAAEPAARSAISPSKEVEGCGDGTIDWPWRRPRGGGALKPQRARIPLRPPPTLFALIFRALASNTQPLLWAALVVNHALDASLLSLPPAVSVFLYAALETPRPSRSYSNALILYFSTVLVLKVLYQARLPSGVLRLDRHCPRIGEALRSEACDRRPRRKLLSPLPHCSYPSSARGRLLRFARSCQFIPSTKPIRLATQYWEPPLGMRLAIKASWRCALTPGAGRQMWTSWMCRCDKR